MLGWGNCEFIIKMVKQLLVIFKLILLTRSLCVLPQDIPQLATYSATLLNLNLNATSQDYPLPIPVAASSSPPSFAIAINQIDITSPSEWNLSIASSSPTVVLSFKNALVNWVKVSCIVWTSTRADLFLGTYNIQLNKSSPLSQLQVQLNRSIANYDSSIVVAFLNGFKLGSNSSFDLSVTPFKVGNGSFMVNISNTNNITIKGILISYIIFSPVHASFQVYGDNIAASLRQEQIYFDAAQEIPNTPFKLYGLSGVNTLKSVNFEFTSAIDSDYVLTLSSNLTLELTIEYLYLLPGVLACPSSCTGSLIYNNTCVEVCPDSAVPIANGDLTFCRSCPEKLNLISDRNGSCICRSGYLMSNFTSCVKIDNGTALNTSSASTGNSSSPSGNTTAQVENKTLSGENLNLTLSKNATVVSDSNKTKNGSLLNQTASNASTSSNSSAPAIGSSTTNQTNDSTKTSPNSTANTTLTPTNTSKVNTTVPPSNTTNKLDSDSISKALNLSAVASPPREITPSSPVQANCSQINNSMLINNKCLCKLGYVNLTNNCLSIVSLGNPFSPSPQPTPASTPAIKASTACPQNQQFSITTNKCICSSGFAMNATKCISVCSSVQTYDKVSNSCLCNSGYSRVNSLCIVCTNTSLFSLGNETCYPLLNRTNCRNNYLLVNGSCLSCFGLNVSSKSNDSCSVCSGGFVYNGYNCTCPSSIINQTCISPTCGNKKQDAGETCDDGNTVNDDGCSSSCLIESNYFCSGLPSVCFRTICGNGVITGGEECDDNNTKSGDGCSSSCLVEANYTCIGCTSTCVNVQVGNLSLISVSSNTNNIFVVFQTPRSYSFPNAAFMQTFLQFKFLSHNVAPGIVYCQQEMLRLNRFDCLLIFPSGVPLLNFVMLFSYSNPDGQGALLVNFNNFKKC